MFNFHPKLKMTPITCLRSSGQNEEELKKITMPEKFWPYISKGHLKCFMDVCDTVLEKKQKQVISTLCMIEMWMVYRCLKYYFDTVVKINNYQLTQEEKEDFHIFAYFNPQNKKVSHCYFCEFPLECKVLNPPEKPTRECSRLDLVIRRVSICKKYFFSKTNFRIKTFEFDKFLLTLTFLLKAYEFLAKQADHSVMIAEKKIK